MLPGDCRQRLFGVALDIGTTSNVVYLVDLVSGEVVSQAVDYNGQMTRGEDVISRIIYAGKNNGLAELQELVVRPSTGSWTGGQRRAHAPISEIYKATVVGNSTMIHLFLGLPPQSIRLSPFVTTVNQPPPVRGGRTRVGASIRQATVDCLPGVASYVGADISAGVVSSGLDGQRKADAVPGCRHQRRDGAGQPRLAGGLRLFGRPGL